MQFWRLASVHRIVFSTLIYNALSDEVQTKSRNKFTYANKSLQCNPLSRIDLPNIVILLKIGDIGYLCVDGGCPLRTLL